MANEVIGYQLLLIGFDCNINENNKINSIQRIEPFELAGQTHLKKYI